MTGTPSRLRRIAAWGVHLFTASSAPAALLALMAITRGDARTAFWCMAFTIAVDALDGTLARAVEVKRVLPKVDGARLDDCVDYVTYVIVPAFFLIHMDMLPRGLALPVAGFVAVASGYGFAQTDAKTPDHYFTGFPSYWNIVVFYLWALHFRPVTNAAIVTAFAIGVFVPLHYVYPSRTTVLRPLTVGGGLAWAALVLASLIVPEAKASTLLWVSLAYPVYYFALSFALHLRELAS